MNQTLVDAVVVVVGLAVSGALGFVILWLAEKRKTSRLWNAVAVAATQAKTIVANIEVDERAELAGAWTSGQLAPGEGAKLKAIAVSRLMNSLPAATKAILEAAFSADVPGTLGGLVEEAHTALDVAQKAIAVVAPAVPAVPPVKPVLSDPGRTAEFVAHPPTPR